MRADDDYDSQVGRRNGRGQNSSGSSQKGGRESSGRLSRRQHSDISDVSSNGMKSPLGRKSTRHDQLRELVGEIVTNMGYDGIPIVRIKGNKYVIGTEIQYLQ